jgi:DnaJ-class molecular chaperone
MENNTRTLYEILGARCSRDTTEDELRKCYFAKARLYHPDKLNGCDSNEFGNIQAAWETLRDRESRKRYDDAIFITCASSGGCGDEKDYKQKQQQQNEFCFMVLEIDLDDCEFQEQIGEFKARCRCGEKISFSYSHLEEVSLLHFLFSLLEVICSLFILGNAVLSMSDLLIDG